LVVYNQKDWESDKWDAMDYNLKFDFSKNFYEQFKKLQIKIPHSALYSKNSENSQYINFSLNAKDSYLIF
jgi:hypothetical protein